MLVTSIFKPYFLAYIIFLHISMVAIFRFIILGNVFINFVECFFIAGGHFNRALIYVANIYDIKCKTF